MLNEQKEKLIIQKTEKKNHMCYVLEKWPQVTEEIRTKGIGTLTKKVSFQNS